MNTFSLFEGTDFFLFLFVDCLSTLQLLRFFANRYFRRAKVIVPKLQMLVKAISPAFENPFI